MAITKICVGCGNTFSVYPSNADHFNFCSLECKRANTPRRICAKCGKEFTVKQSVIESGRGRYCSKACWNTRGNPQSRPCAICSKPMQATVRDPRKYCSYECRNIGKLLENPYYNCDACGKRFIDRKHRDRRYCSRQCAGKGIEKPDSFVCETCGTTVSAPPWVAKRHRYCSRECFNRSTARTSIEIAVADMLKTTKYSFSEQYQIGPYTCDFCLPAHELIIEADGTYWHSKKKSQRIDKAKNTYLRNRGYKLLRLSEADINARPDWCKEQISLAIHRNGTHDQLSLPLG